MRERRKHPRIEVSHPVLFYSHIYPRPKVASTVDISLGGALIETRQTLTAYEGIDLSIAIRTQVIQCRAQVVHVFDVDEQRVHAGIRFEDLSLQDRHFLGRYITSALEQHPS